VSLQPSNLIASGFLPVDFTAYGSLSGGKAAAPKSPKAPPGPKSRVAASTLPLTIPERVARNKVRTGWR
jgi:hypothetical protein